MATTWIGWLLLGAAVGFGLLVAGPLLVAPLWWARRFGWTVPDDRHLTIYLGRCLGGVGLAILYVGVRAARDPAAHPLVLELITGACAILTIVHVLGALERAQPPIETIEIAVYGALTVAFAIARATM